MILDEQILEPEALMKAAVAEASAYAASSQTESDDVPDMVQLGQQAKQALEVSVHMHRFLTLFDVHLRHLMIL